MNTVNICTYVSVISTTSRTAKLHRYQFFTTDKNLILRYNIETFDKKVQCENRKYLFSVIITVIFLYIATGVWRPLITYSITFSFPNKLLNTNSFILSTVALVGARNKVWGLASMFTLTFSSVTVSSLRDTRAFLFNRCNCLLVGIPALNDAK